MSKNSKIVCQLCNYSADSDIDLVSFNKKNWSVCIYYIYLHLLFIYFGQNSGYNLDL